jgi:hypothetical protein
LPSSPQAMVYCLSRLRRIGNILSILLILSKNLGESMRCVNDTCSNCLPTQSSEEPKKDSLFTALFTVSGKHGYFDRAFYCKTVPMHLEALDFVKGFRCHVAPATRRARNKLFPKVPSFTSPTHPPSTMFLKYSIVFFNPFEESFATLPNTSV